MSAELTELPERNQHSYTQSTAHSPRRLVVLDLGVVDYAECWKRQKQLAGEVAEGRSTDTLLLLEHPHTFTCGRRGGRDHILVGDDQLMKEGVTVLDVDRGGDVTYHGPGQLVAYPILRLAEDGQPVDYHGYVRLLEQTLINTVSELGIEGFRVPGYSGVWVEHTRAQEKIAAVGVKVDGRGVSTHGVALNVTTDLSYFGYIVPCGISDKGVTSISTLLGKAPDSDHVKSVFISEFCRAFHFQMTPE